MLEENTTIIKHNDDLHWPAVEHAPYNESAKMLMFVGNIYQDENTPSTH